MNPTTSTRQSYAYLRSVCRDFCERMMLGDAIKNGWTAATLSKLAEEMRTAPGCEIRNKALAYRSAIETAAYRPFHNTEKNEIHVPV